MVASVFQDPRAQATSAVQSALKMIKGEPVETDVWVPFQLIRPEQLTVFEQYYK
ncbi:Sugar ABC transporter periplasmic sugar-binding protein [Pseudomonas cannabina]|uniref:Sugar ABC transporter periplasmic sugar-binding protein n=1 Tax=Pseudomonas cannabina TaxID=86840 RepID=A0A3M3RWA9_PSECA|nr:Sugar ABC transporter periplasmic sugar-binding protein [Pseudomonas cannabina]